MGARDWVVPLVAALVALSLLWFVNPGTTGPAATGLVYPFPDHLLVNSTSQSALQLLVVSGPAQQKGLNQTTGVTWRTPHVGVVASQNGDLLCIRAPCDPLRGPTVHHHAIAGSHLFGVDGYNATRVTAYFFDESATLVASNADAANRSRFASAAQTQDLPDAMWYLGANDTAPSGTAPLPALAAALIEHLRPQLEGLPVGGVASDSSNVAVALYGTLFVTVQIDELTYAP